MLKSRKAFVVFLIVWLSALNYLIFTKATLNYPLLIKLSKPFVALTGNVTGINNSNHFLALIVFNFIIAVLFSMSYLHWEAKKREISKKK